MREGDYVRTKDYGFIKVKSFYYNEDMIHILDENCNEYDFSKKLVDDFKSSANIIDLIEVGDYVNGHKVVEVDLDDIDDYGNTFRYIKTEHDYTLNHWVKENEIESVLTKEQFESMEYKLEVKDEYRNKDNRFIKYDSRG